MPALAERPKNGHARLENLDFSEVFRLRELPLPAPSRNEGSRPAAPQRAPLRSVSFQKLLNQLASADHSPPPEAAPFPLKALPPVLRRWVAAIAGQTQTAPEAAALLSLAASSAALAGRIKLLGPAETWRPVQLYVGLLTAGDRCEEVLAAAIEPLRALEFEELESHASRAAGDRFYQRDYGRDLRRAERKAERDGDSDELDRILKERIELELMEPRPAPRRLLDDVTARSLRYQLGELGRIACFSPSGEIFRQIAGRSSASRQRLIELLDAGHAGRRLVVDRAAGKQTPLAAPSIAIGSLIDGPLVAAIAGQRECHARGLLSRFLFAAPPSRVGARAPAQEASLAALDAYHAGIRRLATGNLPQAGDEEPLLAPGGGRAIFLSPAAMNRFLQWEQELEPLLAPRGTLAPIGEWGRNLADTTLRFAAILHCWSHRDPFISEATLTAAIEIARWLVPQAAAALAKLGAADDNCTERERTLLRYARHVAGGNATGEFSPREAWQHLRKTFLQTSALRHTLARLVHLGYLRVACEGARFPRRFALAALPIAQQPLAGVSTFAEPPPDCQPMPKRKKKTGRGRRSACAPPKQSPPIESTESTQPASSPGCSVRAGSDPPGETPLAE